MYKYKLNEEVSRVENFQQDRISSFDNLEKQLIGIKKALRIAKNETIKYYNENPQTYEVVYGTDLIQDYFKDIKILLRQEDKTYENPAGTV